MLQKIERICDPAWYDIGFASLSGLLRKEFAGFEYGLVLARRMDDEVMDRVSRGPDMEYYELYQKVNDELNQNVSRITEILLEHGCQVLPVTSTVSDGELDGEYKEQLRYWLSHKMVATRAGIGWIGKTGLLISFRFGPRVRLASILLDSKIAEPGRPVNDSLCGSCMVCVHGCPVQAANGKSWTTSVDRNEFYDPFKCMAHCRDLSLNRIGKNISLCGICVSVCPKGLTNR